MEKEYKISWLKVMGILALIVIVIAILCLVYPKKNSNAASTSSVYLNNIMMMKEAGFEYFQGDNLPDKIGESNKITLDEMITSNLIVEFIDENGKTCNEEDSYIQATKTLDDEYTLKVFLSCEDKTDYIITTIVDDACPTCNSQNTIKDNDSVSTNSVNNPVNTNTSSTSSSGAYRVINNVSNITSYNISYINSCNNCTSNCSGNCLSNIYYTVNFNSNGGTSVPSQIVKSGSTATYQTTTRVGYTFLGWYLDGIKYDFSTPVTQKITLLAKWQKTEEDKNKYTVKFNSNGGTSIPSQTVEEGNKAIVPNNPTKACYEFAGWYTNSGLTNKYNFNNAIYNDITLYAKWIDDGSCVETHKVQFDSNGGTSVATQIVDDGSRAVMPNNPTRSGYTFIGWYLNGIEFNFNTRIYDDIVLVAKWEKNQIEYNTYCKITDERIYSTGYVGGDIANKTSYSLTYQLKYVNNYALNMQVIGYGNISDAEYTKAYNYWKANNKPISLVNGSGDVIDALSGTNLKIHSLKSTNLSPRVTYNYHLGNNWYFTVYDTLYNLNNISALPYYINSSYYIYFVPIYFDIEYTDLSNCVDDKAAYAYKYVGYEIVDSYYD